jgi:hypothetical protein
MFTETIHATLYRRSWQALRRKVFKPLTNDSTQLSGFSEHEMNHPLALCELVAKAPNISAGHKVKQAWLSNDRVFRLDIHCHALV